MKNMRIIMPAVLAVCLLVVPLARSQRGNAEEQIEALSEQLIQALLKGDTSFFEKYYADDAVIIRGRGDQYTKAQEIEIFKSGANKFETYDVHERKIRAYGDTAIENVKASARGSIKGQPFSSDYRVSRVWIEQKGNWKLVLYQVTPIAGASHQ